MPQGEWPNWALGTHDASRIVTRAGARQARVAAMLLLTLRGTPTIYYGDEIGMCDVDIPRGEIVDLREIITPYLGLGRDPARTPMQWNREPNAGFTTGKPWLPIADNAADVNVNVASQDPRSMLALYRRLIALRRETPALVAGGYQTASRDDGLLVYTRELEGRRVAVALNFTSEPRSIEIEGTIVLSTHLDREGEKVSGKLELRPDEGIILA
jgi:alpha-glucosidase